jgi:phosphoglycolate phosphatase-like HAD superfamily hydrolase
MTTAARQLFGPTFSLEEVDRNGRLDPEIIGMAMERNGVRATRQQLEAFRRSYIDQLRNEVQSTRILPGVRELLAALRATRGVLLGCVTGNFAEATKIKLQAARIDPAWFAANGFGGEAHTRSDLVRVAIDRGAALAGQPFTGRHVIILGDTPRDVEAAQANGCACLAVATGNYTIDVLRAAGPDAVIADLTTPGPLWALLERAEEPSF